MSHKKPRLLPLLLIACILAACSASEVGPGLPGLDLKGIAGGYETALVQKPARPAALPGGSNEAPGALKAGLAAFGYETAPLLLAGETGNGNVSPASLYLSLALLANGTEGQTQADLLARLGMADIATLNAESAALMRLLANDNDYGVLSIQNSLWMQEDYSFREGFVNTAVNDYSAWLFRVDFKGEAAGKYMSQWTKDQVHGTLAPNYAPDADTIAATINTVYYKSRWYDEFWESRTEQQPFYLQNGASVDVDMMNEHRQNGGCIIGDGYLAINKMTLLGHMRFVLPDEGVSVDDLLASPGALASALESDDYTEAEISFGLPKFTFSNSYELADALALTDLPLGALAAPAAGANIIGEPALSEVRQDTYIAVDELGIEASAATEVAASAAAAEEYEELPRIEIILDRPFLYCLFGRDGVPLFIGVVRDPTK